MSPPPPLSVSPFPTGRMSSGSRLTAVRCHSNAVRHGELTATKSSCAPCHHEPLKKGCGECHPLQKTVYSGGLLGDVEVPEDIMAEAGAACVDCHLDKSKKVVRPDGGACVACHDETYRATFGEWRDTIRRRVDEIRSGSPYSLQEDPDGDGKGGGRERSRPPSARSTSTAAPGSTIFNSWTII